MLAANGARVVVADLKEERGLAVASEINGVFSRCDVSGEEDGKAAVEAGVKLGTLAGLVNCAGVAPAQKTVGKAGTHDLAAVHKNPEH